MKQLSEEFVVKLIECWIDTNYKYLFIQMELCFESLEIILYHKRMCFKRRPIGAMNSIEFFISCQLFLEILEGIRYLHHQSIPAIIHRDLKPANILLRDKPRNGRFIKLCDFGLATFDCIKTLISAPGKGTSRYMPLECHTGKYSIMTDIYSLGVITQEIFDFDLNE